MGFSSYVFAQEEALESGGSADLPVQIESDQSDSQEEEPVKEGFKSNWFVGVGEGAVVNKFKDNWFAGAGPAYQFFSGEPASGSLMDHSSMGFQIHGGKWMTPDFAFRFGFQGMSFVDYKQEKQTYISLHYDMMVNIQNLFMGYSENRMWNISPYVGPAFLMSSDDVLTHYGFGFLAGLHNTFNMNGIIPYVGDKVFLVLDLSALLSDKEFDHCTYERVNGKKVRSRGLDKIYTVSIGAIYRFPKRGWTSSFIMY